MTLFGRHRQSLTGRLVWALVGSLTVVAIVLGAAGALFIEGIAEQTSDRVLGASSRAIAETLAVEDGRITLDLPPSALGMLENNERDNVYYSVWRGKELLTGYADLPRTPLSALNTDKTDFRYGAYRGTTIRLATEARRLPRIDGLVVVQVAETLEARHVLVKRMLFGLVFLEALLLIVTGVLIWPALKWSLRPVTRLQAAMEIQPIGGAHFVPLQADSAPIELTGLVNGFNALLSRLDEAVDGIRRFTSDASHQMRTPLAVLRTHVALLRRHVRPGGQESLHDVDEATDRLQRLLTRLITLARADEADPSATTGRCDITKTARTVVADLQAQASHAAVQISVTSEGAGIADADPVLVGEILSNLLDNAIRYNRRGGRVEIRVADLANGVSVCVRDDGPGIPDQYRDQVFERFFRLSRDQQRPGSGLGLSIVRALVKKIGAEIQLSTGPDATGLEVRVLLPIYQV